MIIARISSYDDAACCRVERSLYLASLIKNRTGIIFCIDKNKELEKLLDERKFHYFYATSFPQNIEQQSKAVLFDVATLGKVEKECLARAKQAGVPVIRFLDTGAEPETAPGAGAEALLYREEEGNIYYFSGPGSALLHHKYRHFHIVQRKYRKKTKYLFIDLAGSVEYRRYRKIIDSLSRHGYTMKIVPDSQLKKSYRKILRRIYPQVRFTGDVESLARAFFEADAAIILPGFAAYRAAATGTPALYFCGSKEHQAIAGVQAQAGAGIPFSGNDLEELAAVPGKLTQEQRAAMGEAGKKWVDGKGIYRVIDFFKEKGII